MLAKDWGPSDDLAADCGKFANLKTLRLENFEFEGCKDYLSGFCSSLKLATHCHLHIVDMVVEDVDLARLIRNHRKILHQVVLTNVDVHGGWTDFATSIQEYMSEPDEAEEYTEPWSRVLEARLVIEDQCSIQIDRPKHKGKEARLVDSGLEPMYDGYAEFFGTTVDLVPEGPDDYECEDWYYSIKAKRDADRKKGVYWLLQMYEYPIHDPERDGTPPFVEEVAEYAEYAVKRLKEESKTPSPQEVDSAASAAKNDIRSSIETKNAIDDKGELGPRRPSRFKPSNRARMWLVFDTM